MKKFLTLISLLSISSWCLAQKNEIVIQRSPVNAYSSTLKFEEGSNYAAKDLFNYLLGQSGYSSFSEMKLQNVQVSTNGMKHYRFQQFYKNLEIYGAYYILHEQKGKTINGNGILTPETDLLVEPTLSTEDANSILLATLNVKNDNLEIHKQKLVIINEAYPNFDKNFVLAYVIEVHLQNSDSRKIIINAHTGEVLQNFSMVTECFKDLGKMKTRYHGERDVNTEKETNGYLTKDLSRGKGIFVTNKSGVLYKDDDNIWESGTDDYRNGVHDLFWGLQKTFDFYQQKLNRNGIDNAFLPVKAILWDTQAYVNAFWQPTQLTLTFGIGDGGNYAPLTSIDVVGHEFTHGVTQFSAGLEYLYEAGAMNEAFSDIFGKAIEYEFDRDSFNWYIGARFARTKAQAFRSMEDPNLFNNPKYYKGVRWATGNGDNGGVHSNSGVLNHWYYLLCTGVKDTNEAKYIYDVKRMGFDTTTRFAYELLTHYLGTTSNYFDAREASLLLASNWWGACSPEYNNVVEAWRAVGLGTGSKDNDLQLVNTKTILNACRDGNYTVEARIINQSCTTEIPAGTEITLYHKLDTFPIVTEKLILNQVIKAGSHLNYIFNSIPRIVKSGQSRLTVWMESNIDSDTSNNRYIINVNRLTNSIDHDFRLNGFSLVGAPCPNPANEYSTNMTTTYNGCTVIPPGNNFELQFNFKDSNYIHRFVNPTSVYPQGNMNINNIKIPRSFLGLKYAQINLVWIKDTVLPNNRINYPMVMINNRIINELETFSNQKYDSTKLQVFSDSFNIHSIITDTSTQSEALTITGGKILNNNGSFSPRIGTDINNMINTNPRFTSKVYVCADISGIVNPLLEFDLAQKEARFNYDSLAVPTSSSTRIVFLDNQNTNLGSKTISAKGTDFEYSHIAEPIPAGTSYIDITNLCLKGSVDSITGTIDPNGDVVIIDNLVITGLTSVKNENFNKVTIYPNPTRNTVFVDIKDEKIKEIQVINTIGELVQKLNVTTSPTQIILDSGAGIYLIKCVYYNGDFSMHKIQTTE